MPVEYPDEKLLDKLRECDAQFNNCTPKTFKKLDDLPEKPIQTVFDRFGDWQTAKQKAGLDQQTGIDTEETEDSTRGVTYSDEQLLGHLRIVEDEMGRVSPQSMREVKNDPEKPDVAGPSIVIARFGRWSDAKEKAGLETIDDRTNNGRSREYTNKDYLELLNECAEKYPKVTQKNFKNMRKESDDDLPSASAIAKRFDSWTEAKEIAGIEEERTRHQQYTDDELITMLKECGQQYEKCTARVFDENFDVSVDLIRERFGSWNAGKEKAGLETFNNSDIKITEDELIAQLRECYKKHGKCTSPVFNDDEEFCSSATVLRRFDDWETAKRKAGLIEATA